MGEETAVPGSSPPQHPGTRERGKGPGQGQGNTRFLSHSHQFLRASLEPVEDKAWTIGLSQELSQRLGSSAAGSWEKVCVLPGTGAGAGTGALPTQPDFTAFLSLVPKRRFPWAAPAAGHSLASWLALPAPGGGGVHLGPALS